MLSFVYAIGIILLIFILTVESTYYVYTYDDSIDDNEHCCLVRLGENFCLAKPLTRSLVQVNKECQRLDANEKKKNYLNKIIRRLYVETSQKIHDKILLELKTPLEKDILKDDLLCLSLTNNNNINLDKCYVELVDNKHKKQNKKISNEDNTIHRIEITDSIQIHEGHGLTFRQIYELNLTDFRPTTHQKRQCWLWYRKHIKKSKKSCISLNNYREKCLEEFFYKKINENEQELYKKNSIKIGSKLYCENNNQQNKLLGYHRQSKLCFQTRNQIYIQHKFTDFVNLSDINKNKYILQFISNNTKLTSEFENDCNDKITLVDITKSLEKKPE